MSHALSDDVLQNLCLYNVLVSGDRSCNYHNVAPMLTSLCCHTVIPHRPRTTHLGASKHAFAPQQMYLAAGALVGCRSAVTCLCGHIEQGNAATDVHESAATVMC